MCKISYIPNHNTFYLMDDIMSLQGFIVIAFAFIFKYYDICEYI